VKENGHAEFPVQFGHFHDHGNAVWRPGSVEVTCGPGSLRPVPGPGFLQETGNES
jgi:hypothetical protein